MAGTFTSLHHHLVFSTKDRFPFIHNDLQPRLYEYLGGIIRSDNGTLLEIGGMPDHIHLLIRWLPNISLSDLLRVIKSKSSGWTHDNFSDQEKVQMAGGVRRLHCQ